MATGIISSYMSRITYPTYSSLTSSLKRSSQVFYQCLVFYGIYQNIRTIQYKCSFSVLNPQQKNTLAFAFAYETEEFMKEGKIELADQSLLKCKDLLKATTPSNSFSEIPNLRDQVILKLIAIYAKNQNRVFELAKMLTSVDASLEAIESLENPEYKLNFWKIAFQAYEKYNTQSIRILLKFAKALHSSQKPQEVELKNSAIQKAINHFKTLTDDFDKANDLEHFAQYIHETKETTLSLDLVNINTMSDPYKFSTCLAQAKIAKEKDQDKILFQMVSECCKIINSNKTSILDQVEYICQLLKLAPEVALRVDSKLLDIALSLADRQINTSSFDSPDEQLISTKTLLKLLDLFRSINHSKYSKILDKVALKIHALKDNTDKEIQSKIKCYFKFSKLVEAVKFSDELKYATVLTLYNRCKNFAIQQEICLLICKIHKNLAVETSLDKIFMALLIDLSLADISLIEKISKLTELVTRTDCFVPYQQVNLLIKFISILETYTNKLAFDHFKKSLITTVALAAIWIFPSTLIPATIMVGAAHLYYGKPPR